LCDINACSVSSLSRAHATSREGWPRQGRARATVLVVPSAVLEPDAQEGEAMREEGKQAQEAGSHVGLPGGRAGISEIVFCVEPNDKQ